MTVNNGGPPIIQNRGALWATKIQNQDEPGPLAAVGALALVGALIVAILIAWHSPAGDGYYAMRRAEALLGEGRYSEAEALLERTLLTYDSPQLRLDLSYAYLARRDSERAERQARIAVQTSPPQFLPASWAQLGRVLSFEGQDSAALIAWEQARKLVQPYIGIEPIEQQAHSALWHIAMTEWAAAGWDAARRDLEELSNGDDVYAASARVKLAQLLVADERGRTKEEGQPQNTEYGIRNTPTPQSTIPNLRVPGLQEGLSDGAIESIKSELERARSEVDRARGSGADEAAIDTLWGGSYLRRGEEKLARQYFERALALKPDYAPAHARLALTLLNLGDMKSALPHLETAVRLTPDDPLAHHLLARLYIQEEEWDKAKAQLTALEKLEPASVEMHLQWADYYRRLGEYEQAENEYIEAANLQVAGGVGSDQGETDAALTLARFYTDVRGFGCEKGLPAARLSLQYHPGDAASLDAVGWALVQCKEAKDALSTLEAAVKVAPDVPRYHFHLAQAYSVLSRYDDAREQYNRALDLDPGGGFERLATSELVNLPR